ncbi:AI-2E family transporter [Nocardioides piscis]|uniref:AI-2E family transporter n=1 Tax=Nocardioides piscis TaxID=2714938 RepID=A0A6G7YBE1_9ACTN|nr:AI-2E family transporter [Nocardioides piscis]QIK74224.1 AI-2E family transporter [Nocardioides piscis]
MRDEDAEGSAGRQRGGGADALAPTSRAVAPVGDSAGAAGHRERRTSQLVQQWAALRAERRPAPIQISTGTSNFSRAQVPWGLDLAAAWSWRMLIIGGAVYVLALVLARLAVVTLPLAISLLLAALAGPGVTLLQRIGLPRALAAAIVMLFGLTTVVLLLTYVGQQVAAGAQDLADSVVAGLGEVKNWLRQGPLNLSQGQLDGWIESTQKAITENSREGGALTQVTEVGTAVGHVLAGFFIVIFATYFFLADGGRIWAWLVQLAPRAARAHVDGCGRVAWVSLEQFVRATVLVALADAIGVMVVAALLGVPFVLALGVLVFLGAFVPMVGATVAGSVAILVALVDQGPITALLMLGGVILVQQIEGHILQPFLMGRFVSVHPLGVIIAIGCGVLVAGIAGALIAVPLVAAANAVANHLAQEVEPEHYDTPLITDEEVDDVEPDFQQDEPERNPRD